MVSSFHGSWLALLRTPPQVDDLDAPVVHAAGSTQLASPIEVLLEDLSHGLEARTDTALDLDMRCG